MNKDRDIRNLRTDYGKLQLTEADLKSDPFELFQNWLDEAITDDRVLDPNAFVLSTLDEAGFPQGRIVLVRGLEGKAIRFFTNYESEKGKQMERHPQASACFFWPALERQVRIKGRVSRVPESESDAYFKSRPRDSQLGAWASKQSAPLPSREILDQKMEALKRQFEGKDIPRPDFWGGYTLEAESLEFWQGRNNRLHDRFLFQFQPETNTWIKSRLNP